MRQRVAVVLGTRPEMVKLAGTVRLLGDDGFVVHTGQHWNDDLAGSFLRDLGIGRPAHELAIGGLHRGEQIGEATAGLTRLFGSLEPSSVVVQGDTNSTLAGALAANALSIPLVHVEAGLRSHDRAMPEEHNRVLVDHVADVCCAPTRTAVDNLLAEGIPSERISLTGNPIVEAFQRLLPDSESRAATRRRLGVERDRYILATIHRPENTDDGSVEEVLRVLRSLPLPVVLPVHPRLRVAAERSGCTDLLNDMITVPPLPYESFLGLLAECALAVSDSGGVQEEVTLCGRPLVVVRRSTERPEAIGQWATLVTPGQAVVGAVARLLDDLDAVHARLAALPSPFGDGGASERIVAEIRRLVRGDLG